MKDIIKKAIEANLTTEEYIQAMDEAHEHFDAIQERQIDKDFHNEMALGLIIGGMTFMFILLISLI